MIDRFLVAAISSSGFRGGKMRVEELGIEGVKKVYLDVYEDNRGFFSQTFQQESYQKLGLGSFVQDNLSNSQYGVIRGMHYQRKPGQAKLLSLLRGKIYDVFVDIRKESPTFMKWMGIEMGEKDPFQLFLPVGVAHGFCSLVSNSLLSYKVSSYYDPNEERGFRYDDPTIGIKWPVLEPILSSKDLMAPYFLEIEHE